jgi:hypothetical protein
MNRKINAVAVSCLLFAGAANGQTSSEGTVRNRQFTQPPPAVETVPQIPQVTAPIQTSSDALSVTIGTTAVTLPLARGQCALDENVKWDREFMNGFRNGAGSSITVLAAIADCKHLADARSGLVDGISALSIFAAPTALLQTTSSLTPQDYARDICQQENRRLNQTVNNNEAPEVAADNLKRSAERSKARQSAVLLTGVRACYVGLVEPAANNNGLLQIVTATTQVKGKAMLVFSMSYGKRGYTVRTLLGHSRRLTPSLAQVNGEPGS